jgi:hypothetical protein
MKTLTLSTLERVECLLYAISIQTNVALPSIQNATEEGKLFWRNVLRISGLIADKFDFQEFVLEVKLSKYTEEIECFGGHIAIIKKPHSWSSRRITQDPFHGKILEILPSINKMLSEQKSPTYITRGHPA